ncbi:hypothetical protein QCA50_015412 [Cerrena zonata]|uniref:Uncharacterized protein n=1 Tax=Cerrena zonata TaxID=2478898 RepID=A0AAW0FVS4_9APHY
MVNKGDDDMFGSLRVITVFPTAHQGGSLFLDMGPFEYIGSYCGASSMMIRAHKIVTDIWWTLQSNGLSNEPLGFTHFNL